MNEKCSALLVVMEMQIKTTVICHFTPTCIAIIKKIITNAVKDSREFESSDITGRNAKCAATMGKSDSSNDLTWNFHIAW